MTIEGAYGRVPAGDFPDLKFERAPYAPGVPPDPPAPTPFEVVDETGLLRLRRYRPHADAAGGPAVLFVYSLFKRPYVLDLLPERSVVRALLAQGFTVYLTDWQAPEADNSERGLDAYVNGDLACAVNHVRDREGVERVALAGNCFGALLALLYAALHPHNVARLATVSAPVEFQTPFAPTIVEYIVRMFGNVPAWWIRAWLNAGVPGAAQLSRYAAEELKEPALARSSAGTRMARALQPWLDSDVPLAGQLFRELMCNAYWSRDLVRSRLRIGGCVAALENILCPVLNVSGENDRLVPPEASAVLTERVGAALATNVVFPATHLGLLLGAAAHAELWPRIGAWLKGGSAIAGD